ncbi:hypothetical protein [Microbulbifer discodermiae]|uniref:hypothetical protein n=1 Tax=Microbulbifer sp. 2201CG32-9 TaxID=3232309 RepID=UPI00345B6733
MAFSRKTTATILKDFTGTVAHLREHAHAQILREEKLAAKVAKLRSERIACGVDARAARAAADLIEDLIGNA